MSRIKGKHTGPELALRRALWSKGFRYRLHARLPGKPDLTFVGPRVVVFVDGCFWHGCPEHGVKPKSNKEFWKRKLLRNMQRDQEVGILLASSGWAVLRFWEHEVRDDLFGCVEQVAAAVAATSQY